MRYWKMGDVTIHLLLDCSLLDGAPPADDAAAGGGGAAASASVVAPPPTTPSFRFRSASCILPGDATLAELVDVILAAKLASAAPRCSSSSASSSRLTETPEMGAAPQGGNDNNNNNDKDDDRRRGAWTVDDVTIIDASYHPPRLMSCDVKRYPDRAGPRSRTLQGCGWYPSGKLAVLPRGKAGAGGGEQEVEGEGEDRRLLDGFMRWQSRNVLQDEEFAYNTPDANVNATDAKAAAAAAAGGEGADGVSDGGAKVKWTGIGAPSSPNNGRGDNAPLKPSEIFRAVERRCDDDGAAASLKPASAKGGRGGTKTKRRTERERTRRLDVLLANLDGGGGKATKGKGRGKAKEGAASRKVRTMLLKSRSEGDTKLRMEDRFHLEVTRVWDVAAAGGDASGDAGGGKGGGGASYRFYSRQCTAGRVASMAAPNLGASASAELLVSYPSRQQRQQQQVGPSEANGKARYRRLPNTATLHEAQANGWLNEFDAVIVRVYSLTGEDAGSFGPSKAVLDSDSDSDAEDDDGSAADENDKDDDDCIMETIDAGGANGEDDRSQRRLSPQEEWQRRMRAIFDLVDDNQHSKKRRKKPPSKQVRSMLIKSKATGDARLRQEDRVYLEVTTLRDDDDDIPQSSLPSSYRYFARQKNAQHVIGAVCDPTDGDGSSKVEFVTEVSSGKTAGADNAYRILSHEMTLGEAMQKGYVENFGRALIRIYAG